MSPRWSCGSPSGRPAPSFSRRASMTMTSRLSTAARQGGPIPPSLGGGACASAARPRSLSFVPAHVALPPPPDGTLPPPIAEDARTTEAAVDVQRTWRGHYARREVELFMSDNYTEASIPKAAAFAASQVGAAWRAHGGRGASRCCAH
eukprot:1973476-Prymnesium_polylepis.1